MVLHSPEDLTQYELPNNAEWEQYLTIQQAQKYIEQRCQAKISTDFFYMREYRQRLKDGAGKEWPPIYYWRQMSPPRKYLKKTDLDRMCYNFEKYHNFDGPWSEEVTEEEGDLSDRIRL